MINPSFLKAPGETTEQFESRIVVYEKQCTDKIESLIDSIFNEADPHVIKLLKDSLQYLKEAKTQEELVVYQASFNEALQRIKYRDIVEIDPCILVLREYADELYYLMELSHEESFDQLSQIRQELATSVTLYVNNFKKTAHELINEFKTQIHNNEVAITDKKSDDSFEEKNKKLEKLNDKYRAGIDKIQKQMNLIDMILKSLSHSDDLSTPEKRIKKRETFAVAMQTLREIDMHAAAHNHFVGECFQITNYLRVARSSYLPKDESLAKIIGKVMWMATKAFVPFAQMIPGTDSVPKQLPSLGYEALTKTGETAEELWHHYRRRSQPQQPLTFGQKAWSFAKKATTVLLGIAGLALSILLCASVIGLSKGIVIAVSSISALDTVRSGSDIFSEMSASKKHIDQVLKNLSNLEAHHEKLEKREVEETKIQHKMSDIESEAKIDMLLMGHKLSDKLTPSELEKLKRKSPTSDHLKATAGKEAVHDEVKNETKHEAKHKDSQPSQEDSHTQKRPH